MKKILFLLLLVSCTVARPFRYEDQRIYYYNKQFLSRIEFRTKYGHNPSDTLLLINQEDKREQDLKDIYEKK